MNVRTETYVVGEIPAHIVGIFVDHDLVAIPEPVADIADVNRSYAEIKPAKPEAAGTASNQPPYVTAAETAREMPVFPGMVEM